MPATDAVLERTVEYAEATLYQAVFSPDSSLVVAGASDGAVKIWDARGGGLRGELDLSANDEFVDSLAFSPDGGLLATGAGLGAVRLWDTRAFRPVGEPLSGHKDFVVSVAFSPDGSMLASSGSNRNICLWNVAGRSLICKLDTRLTYLDTLSFSPDGRLLAAVSDRLVQFVKMV